MSGEVAQIFDDVLNCFTLIFYALAAGGTLWAFMMFGLSRGNSTQEQPILRRVIGVAAVASAGMCLTQVLQLVVKPFVLAEFLQASPFPMFFETTVFQAGVLRAFGAGCLVPALLSLARTTGGRANWVLAVMLALAVSVSGVFFSHAASQSDTQTVMVFLTLVHQLAAALWVGGVVLLAIVWRMGKHEPAVADRLWPTLLGRFSPLAGIALLMLLLTGIPMGVHFVGSWQGLIGTAYGSMLAAKWWLLAAALGLAAANRRAIKYWLRGGNKLDARTVPFMEAEAVVLGAILLSAATLASLPPSTDLVEQQADAGEVLAAFAPKMPRLTSPTHAQARAASEQPEVIAKASASASEYWSDYNHNVAGVMLLVMGFAALAYRGGFFAWGRNWPLGFLAIAVFVLIRADNETWPLGDIGFWEGMRDATTLQHKFGFLIAAGLGVMEWRARNAKRSGARLRYVFPVLCVMGGGLLLTHSHASFELKSEYLTQVSHTVMGVLAVFMGCARLLEIRLPAKQGKVFGHCSVLCMVLIGAVLAFYREPVE